MEEKRIESEHSTTVKTDKFIATLYYFDEDQKPASKMTATHGKHIVRYNDGRTESFFVDLDAKNSEVPE